MSDSLITFQKEELKDFLVEGESLFEKHAEEVPFHNGKVMFSINQPAYFDIEYHGALDIYTVRDEGSLVGYAVFIENLHPHYSEEVLADNDCIYLSPSYRGSGIAKKLIDYAEQDLYNKGITVINISVKKLLPFNSLLEAIGYEEEETVYTKYIGENKDG